MDFCCQILDKENGYMNVAIWGTKKEAIYLAEQIKSNSKGNVICFVDNDERKWKSQIDEWPIYSIHTLEKIYQRQVDTVLIAIRNGYSIACILKQLKQINIKNIGLLKPSTYDFNEEITLSRNSKQIMWLDMLSKQLFPYFQIILNQTCNLNCKGCTHFANLYNKDHEEGFYNLDSLEKDIELIAKNTEIFRLRILGGEPLLYPHIKEALHISRKYFPNSDIRLVTNGLLLTKVSKDLLKCIYDNSIGVDISLYKPIVKIKNRICSLLQEYNINFNFEGIEGEYIKTFEKNINISGQSNPEKAMIACHSKQCLTLLHGKIYKCPFEALSQKFFEYFSFENECNTGYDIKNISNWHRTWDKLYMYPIDSCKYCSEKVETFDWCNTTTPEYSDWMVI